MTSRMVVLHTVLLAAFVAGLLWVRRTARTAHRGPADVAGLPAEDRPPASAVGWPPEGATFATYVDEGLAALEAYLSSEGYAT